MAQFWGGFVNDRLDVRTIDGGFGGWGVNFHRAPAIFTSREDAKRQYRDVRKIEVTDVSKRPMNQRFKPYVTDISKERT